jgi:hypothetical protein
MDEIRAQLDSLMGAHRNVPLSQRDKLRPSVTYSDHKICKYYLCGFCPHSEFTKTKNDIGPCPKVHDDACKGAWEALSDREKERLGYEEQLLRRLDRLKSELSRRIGINRSIVERASKRTVENLYTANEERQLDGMAADIEGMLVQAQMAGEEGDVDGAEGLVQRAEVLREQREKVKKLADARVEASSTAGMEQRVCEISGLIVKGDGEGSHTQGRNFQAWSRLHQAWDRLDGVVRGRRRAGRTSGGGLDYLDEEEEGQLG